MFMRNSSVSVGLLILMASVFGHSVAAATLQGPNLGIAVSPEAIKERDISVFPDGSGLPPGQGTVEAGRHIYESRCAACHGPRGIGASAEELVGQGRLDGPNPDKSIGNYWPHATTIFDYVRRAMPFDAPGSLNDDQVYAVTAYLLHLNGLMPADAVLNTENLPRIIMPNRNGFLRVWPE